MARAKVAAPARREREAQSGRVQISLWVPEGVARVLDEIADRLPARTHPLTGKTIRAGRGAVIEHLLDEVESLNRLVKRQQRQIVKLRKG